MKKCIFSSLQNSLNCKAENLLKTNISVEKCGVSHRIALPDFLILLSKLGKRKFNPAGICNKGDGLVAA